MPERDSPASTRGQQTRLAFVRAGLELFGEQGYHGTSSRALAEAADSNQALIGYHFGGKRGLYLAVFEHVGERMEARLRPAVEQLEALLEAQPAPDRSRLLAALLQVLDRFVETFASSETERWAALLVREQQRPSEAFDVLWDGFMARMLGLLGRLIGALRGQSPDSEEVRLLTLTLIGQALVFRVARAGLLRLLERDELGPDEVEAMQRQVRANARAIFSKETSP